MLRVIFLVFVFLYSCAVKTIVPPTEEELQAARKLKKTVAVLDAREVNSKIKGFSKVLTLDVSDMFSNLGTVNLVERNMIDEIIKEKKLKLSGITESKNNIVEFGKLLGADYIIIPEIISAKIEGPEKAKYYVSRKKDGSFSYGKIWDEIYGVVNIAIRVVEVETGIIKYSYTKKQTVKKEINVDVYKSESRFNESLNYRRKLKRIDSTAKFIASLVGKEIKKEDLTEDYRSLIADAIKKSVFSLRKRIKRDFPVEGEVLDVISEKEVLINLGSAYGIKPGQKLVVWWEGKPVKDPNTGVITVPKREKGKIKVVEVSSGLTSIAKGSKKVIAKIKKGDKITTY